MARVYAIFMPFLLSLVFMNGLVGITSGERAAQQKTKSKKSNILDVESPEEARNAMAAGIDDPCRNGAANTVRTLDAMGRNRAIIIAESLARVTAAIRIVGRTHPSKGHPSTSSETLVRF